MQLSALFGDVRPLANTAPDFIITETMQHACKEFFARSSAWREWLDPLAITANTNQYSLNLPPGASLERVEKGNFQLIVGSTTYANTDLQPLALKEMFDLDQTAKSPTPVAFATINSTGDVQVWPTPDGTQTGNMNFLAIMGSLRSTVQLPDYIVERWRDGLVAGCLWHLLARPGTSWANPALAAENQGIFESYISRARRDSVSGQYAAPLQAKPRKFI